MGSAWRTLVLPTLLVLVVSTDCLSMSGPDECADQLAACHKPLAKYHNITHFAIFDAETDAEVQKICSEYDYVKECVNSIKHTCPSLTQRQYEGYDGVYEYICYEGKATYLKVRMCLRGARLIKEAAVCNYTFQHNLEIIGYYGGNYNDRLEKTCTYVDTYLKCVHKAVEKYCGSEAADWQEEVDHRALQPLLDEVGCKDGQGETYWWLPVAIITPIIIALAAATFCIIMHLRKGSKSRQRRARRHTGMHYHAENRGYGGHEAGVYPVVHPGAPGAMGGVEGLPLEKKGELPPQFLQLPPYMNDPPPEYTEMIDSGSAKAAAPSYAPSVASDARSVMSGKSGKSHKSHKSAKSHKSHADDLQSVRSGGGRSASTTYPQSVRSSQPLGSEYGYPSHQPADGGFM